MRIHKAIYKSSSILLLITFIAMISCDQPDPTAPQDISAKVSTVKILKKSNLRLNKYFQASQLIMSGTGGIVSVGDNASGFSYLEFDPGDINANSYPNGAQITFDWESSDLLSGDFGPHGIQFAHPVYLRLSYKDADLTGIDVNNLHIYWWNDSTEQYDYVTSSSNPDSQFVYAYINHFSRYAIGTDN